MIIDKTPFKPISSMIASLSSRADWVGEFKMIGDHDWFFVTHPRVTTECRLDFPNGRYYLFEGVPDDPSSGGIFGVTLTGPIRQGSIYDKEGAD